MSEFFRDTIADRTRVFTPDELLGYISPIPRRRAGSALRLTPNTNYILLGQLIEHLDATDLNTGAEHLDQAAPLGLDTTYFAVGDAPSIEGLAGGWYPGIIDGDAAAPYDSIASGVWAAGSLPSPRPASCTRSSTPSSAAI